MATEAHLLTAAYKQGRAEALAVLQEEIGAYLMMEDVAPNRVAQLYAAHCREILQSVVEKIKRLP